MKNKWAGLIFALAITAPPIVHAQISMYGAATANYMNNGPYANFLYGGTAGVIFGGPALFKQRVVLSADVQGNFVFNNTEPGPPASFLSPGELYDAVTVGPRLSLAPRFLNLSPYVQMNVGFARYHDPVSHSSTDSVLGGQVGVTRRLASHFDALLDYSYSTFGYNFGYYHPQTFSVGLVYRLAGRDAFVKSSTSTPPDASRPGIGTGSPMTASATNGAPKDPTILSRGW